MGGLNVNIDQKGLLNIIDDMLYENPLMTEDDFNRMSWICFDEIEKDKEIAIIGHAETILILKDIKLILKEEFSNSLGIS